MASALFGFIGVIVGTILSGGVQAMIGWQDRKRQARVAAALIFADLEHARRELAHLPMMPLNPHIESFLEVWHAQRSDLAAGVSPLEYHQLAAAFSELERLLAIYQMAVAPDASAAGDIKRALDVAREVAWTASGMKAADPVSQVYQSAVSGANPAPGGPGTV